MKAREVAEGVAVEVEGTTMTLLRQAGEGGQLYGSVTTRDIAVSLGDEGVSVTRGQVTLAAPIKEIGIHDVSIRLHAEVSVQVRVNVARSDEEAELQLAAGEAVSAEDVFESQELAEAAVEALTDTDEDAEAEDAAGEEAETESVDADAPESDEPDEEVKED